MTAQMPHIMDLYHIAKVMKPRTNRKHPMLIACLISLLVVWFCNNWWPRKPHIRPSLHIGKPRRLEGSSRSWLKEVVYYLIHFHERPDGFLVNDWIVHKVRKVFYHRSKLVVVLLSDQGVPVQGFFLCGGIPTRVAACCTYPFVWVECLQWGLRFVLRPKCAKGVEHYFIRVFHFDLIDLTHFSNSDTDTAPRCRRVCPLQVKTLLPPFSDTSRRTVSPCRVICSFCFIGISGWILQVICPALVLWFPSPHAASWSTGRNQISCGCGSTGLATPMVRPFVPSPLW